MMVFPSRPDTTPVIVLQDSNLNFSCFFTLDVILHFFFRAKIGKIGQKHWAPPNIFVIYNFIIY